MSKRNATTILSSIVSTFGGQRDDDGNEGYWNEGLFYPVPELQEAREAIQSGEEDVIKVAKKLAKQIAAMGYIMEDKKMSHGHALEIVSKVAGLPSWDVLSGMLKKTSAPAAKITDKGIRHLYIEGCNMGCSNDYSVCPDVIAIIDMDAAWNAAAVLHANKCLLESVRINADYGIGDNDDEFTPYGAWVDIYSTNEDGSPNFGMFCIQQKYTDDVHSKGLYFNQPNCGDWESAWVDNSGGDEVVYVAHHGDALIEKCQFDNSTGRFATDPENRDAVRKVSELSLDVIEKMKLSAEDVDRYELSVASTTRGTSEQRRKS